MKSLLSVIPLLTLLSFPVGAQKPYHAPPYNPDGFNCAVSGRVVDAANKPVARALIVLDDSHQVFFSESDAEGRFLREANCWRPVNRRTLFVTSPFKLGGVVPIAPPEYHTAKLGRAFSGRPIVLKKGEMQDVGDVNIQVHYSEVSVKFQGKEGAPLFQKDVDWGLVWLRVRDGRGRVIQETSLSSSQLANAVRTSESVVSMYLPEGRWYLEVSPDEDKGPWFKADMPITVQRSHSSMEIALRMSAP